MRPAAIDVRIVGRDDNVLVSEIVDDILDQGFVDVDGNEALLTKIVARLLPERDIRHVALHLAILVDPVEQPWQPAAIPL